MSAVSNMPVHISPMCAALASASEKVVANSGQIVVGSLRIRVLQAIDLPAPQAAENGSIMASSWLHLPFRNPLQHQNMEHHARPNMICVLLQTTKSKVLATEARPWSSAICWDEEFHLESVTSSDELVLFLVDRVRNDTYASLPLQSDVMSSPGLIGKVPLVRLPVGQPVEQWYSLIRVESSLALRTALRVSLLFNPNEVPAVVMTHSPTRRRVTPTSVLSPSSATEISSASPVSKSLRTEMTNTTAISLESGVIDYVIVVEGAEHSNARASLNGAHVRFRYPPTDRHEFPLPTKIEWFCFPNGPEIITQTERPHSKLFSFVLVGGDDGLCRSYVVCLIVYHHRSASSETEKNNWHGSCLAFVTRIPLIKEISTCLFAVAQTWMAANRQTNVVEGVDVSRLAYTQIQLLRLCHEITLPIRGVFGVQFAINNSTVRLLVPSITSIYTIKETAQQELRRIASTSAKQASPTTRQRSFNAIQQGFQPSVYSLKPMFQLFDIKSIIYLVVLVLCEYRILIHSTQQSLLCPVCEGLCTLIYPFRWQHPYVPILPRVLSEYLQAPLPYILGIHSSWLQSLIENSRPEYLVVVDIDRGTIQLQEVGGPVMPHKLTTALCQRLKMILHTSSYKEIESVQLVDSKEKNHISIDERLGDSRQDGEKEQCLTFEWGSDTEKQVRLEFVCFLSALMQGYRDCLFFVNQKLPVFNKRRFFESESVDGEVIPLVTRLFSTQTFQSFLENHSSPELSVFHFVYITLCREPKDLQWSNLIRASKSQHLLLDTGPVREDIPILVSDDPSYSFENDDDFKSESGSSSKIFHTDARCCEELDFNCHESLNTLGRAIEKLLDEESSVSWTPFAMEMSDIEALTAPSSKSIRKLDHEILGHKIGVEPNLLKANARLLQNAHQVNQYRLHFDSTIAAAVANSTGSSDHFVSSDNERFAQVLHKTLTAVFTSDDSLTESEIRACEAHFKSIIARDLFVLILMQPNNQYVECVKGSLKTSGIRSSSAWYNPKGSGSYIGTAGFRLLARLATAVMNQCAAQEDFTTARGILQVASQYYHYVEDKQSGIGFALLYIRTAKKEYLVTPLRLLPICRSLELWQHAFTCDIGDINKANPAESDGEDQGTVEDEDFFTVTGSLVYDMLNFEVPLKKVQTFVTVMSSTYQKEDLLETLKQLAENVYRALDMSKIIKSSPSEGIILPRMSTKSLGQTSLALASKTELYPASAPSSVMSAFAESPVLSREYDLNTVIRRKISVGETPSIAQARKEYCSDDLKSCGNQQAADWMSRTPPTRRRSSAVFSSALLATSSSPVLCLAINNDRAALGLADAHVNVVDINPSEDKKGIRLECHSDAVVTIRMRGNALISGSRDNTLRAWDLRGNPKKRDMLSFFSMSSKSSNTLSSKEDYEVDGTTVSKRSLVMRGHLAAISCMELGHQLGIGRSLLASGSDDGTVRLWDTTKECSVALLSGHRSTGKPADNGGVSCLRLLASDDDLATGYRRRTVQIWDLAVCKLKVNVEAHQAGIRDLQVSGTRLVTAANDRVVKVWDTAFRGSGHTMQAVQELRGHGGPVQCVILGGPADPTICAGSADGQVRVWDLRYVQRGPRLTLSGHMGPVTRLQRDFTKLVSAGEDGWLRIWNLLSGLCLREKQAHFSGLTCLEMQDSLVYSGSWDGSVRVWDIENAI
ncbi:putative cDENN domain, uDENN domain, WD40/YVTN repeat-like-containing domain superfamily [Plasmopara halstedii]